MGCAFCGKPDTPVRQVPVSIACSECYCDDCVDACYEAYKCCEPPLLEPTGEIVWDEEDQSYYVLFPDGTRIY